MIGDPAGNDKGAPPPLASSPQPLHAVTVPAAGQPLSALDASLLDWLGKRRA